MSSIQEGLTIEGQPGEDLGVNSDAGFNAALAAKISQAREPAAAPAEERSEPVAPDYDDAAAIKAQLLSDEGSTAVKDGLSSPGEQAARDAQRAANEAAIEELERTPEHQRWRAQEEQRVAQKRSESLELAELRADAAESDFWEAILEEGYDKVFEHFAKLRSQISPERAEEVAHEFIGIDENTPEDSHLWNELDALDEAAAQIAAQVEFQASAQLANAMREHVSQQTERELKKTLNGWARSEGLSGAQARARISQVEQFMGHDLRQVAQEFGVAKAEDILRAGDALMDEGVYAERVARFKEQMLSEPSTSISERLEVLKDNGYQPVVPRPQIGTQIDPERVARKATSRGRTTSQDIRRGVAQTDRIQAGMDEMRKLATKLAGDQIPKPRTPAGF